MQWRNLSMCWRTETLDQPLSFATRLADNSCLDTSHKSMTACEVDEGAEGSVLSPATVYYVHAFRLQLR